MESVSILIVIFHLQSTLLSIISFDMETISLNRVDTIVYLVDMELPCGLWILFYFKLNVCRNEQIEDSRSCE